MSRRFSQVSVALLSIVAVRAVPADVAAAPPDQSAIRQEFVAAMQRLRQHAPEPPDSPQLLGYPIYDYLVAARLQRDLGAAPDEQLDRRIDAFLQQHGREPVARSLRHDWLTSLVDRGRWDWFLARSADTTDPALLCDRLQGRIATGDTAGLGVQALALWQRPQQQPRECERVFSWLRLQGLLSPSAAETRARAALAAGNARLGREAAADVPAARAAPLLQWAQLLEEPRSVLDALASDPTAPVESEALVAGFRLLSRSDSRAALALLPRLSARPDVTPAQRAQLLRFAALGAAYDHNPAAIVAFAALPREAIDDEAQEWRVRTALWVGDYTTALGWIEQMPANLAGEPRWRYWRARAVEAASGTEVAAPLFDDIAGLRDYYGYLAADRLHHAYSLHARASADDAAAQAALASAPGLIRAHELFECGMADEAALEWAVLLANAQPATRVQAAHLAAGWGWYAQAIATLAQAGEFDDLRLRYPRPYAAEVERASALTRLPDGWILSVMRQESLFRRDAVSHADARGLMQLLPSTAGAVARRWHLPPLRHEDLFDPGVAIALGAAYLREMVDRYDGALGPSLAAYNAGPQAVSRWLPREPMAADVWIENIPFAETRAYVQHVLEHIVAYAWTLDAEPPRFAALLPPVESASTPIATAGWPGAARVSGQQSSAR